MVALRKRLPVRMDVREFLAWDAQELSGRRWELRDGQPVPMAPASERHGAIISELAALLVAHLRGQGSPCRVVIAPGIVPHVRSDENFRIPDLGSDPGPWRDLRAAIGIGHDPRARAADRDPLARQ